MKERKPVSLTKGQTKLSFGGKASAAKSVEIGDNDAPKNISQPARVQASNTEHISPEKESKKRALNEISNEQKKDVDSDLEEVKCLTPEEEEEMKEGEKRARGKKLRRIADDEAESKEAAQATTKEMSDVISEQNGAPEVIEIEDDSLKPYEKLRELNDDRWCPMEDSPQSHGQRMPFSLLVRALSLIEKQSGAGSKTIIIEIITNVLRSAIVNFPSELANILYFLILKLAPDFAAVETGVGESLVANAIAKACGKSLKDIRTLKKNEGDYGTVVQMSKSSQSTMGTFFKKAVVKETAKKYLKFNHVFSEFHRISKCSGNNSSNAKEGIIVKLI